MNFFLFLKINSKFLKTNETSWIFDVFVTKFQITLKHFSADWATSTRLKPQIWFKNGIFKIVKKFWKNSNVFRKNQRIQKKLYFLIYWLFFFFNFSNQINKTSKILKKNETSWILGVFVTKFRTTLKNFSAD